MGSIRLQQLIHAALGRFHAARDEATKKYHESVEQCPCNELPERLTQEVLDQMLVATHLGRPSPAHNVGLLIDYVLELTERIEELEQTGKIAGAHNAPPTEGKRF